MAQSTLDPSQIVQRTYDAVNDAVRVEIGGGTSFQLSLDATSGDTIGIQGVATYDKVSLAHANTGVVVPAFSCVGMKSFNLYTNTTSTIVGAQVCTLEVSPHDTDNVWINSGVTITPSTTSGVVVMGTASSSIVARRARVSTAAAITSGTYDLYVVAQGL